MATEIRHKGPIIGQTVLYTDGSGNRHAAQTSAINADGTINVLAFVDQQTTLTVATEVPYDGRGVLAPSWMWSDDL